MSAPSTFPGNRLLEALAQELSLGHPLAGVQALVALRLGMSETAIDEALSLAPRSQERALWRAALCSGETRSVDRLLAWGARADMGLSVLITEVAAAPLALAQQLLSAGTFTSTLPPQVSEDWKAFGAVKVTTWLGLAASHVRAHHADLLSLLAEVEDFQSPTAEAEWALGLIEGHPPSVYDTLSAPSRMALDCLLEQVPLRAYTRPLPLTVPRSTAMLDEAWEPGLDWEERDTRHSNYLKQIPTRAQMTAQQALLTCALIHLREDLPLLGERALRMQDWSKASPELIWPILLHPESWGRLAQADRTTLPACPHARAVGDLMVDLVRSGLRCEPVVPVRMASVVGFLSASWVQRLPWEMTPLGRLCVLHGEGHPLPLLSRPQQRGMLESLFPVALFRQPQGAAPWVTALEGWMRPAFLALLAPEDQAGWLTSLHHLKQGWAALVQTHPEWVKQPGQADEGMLLSLQRQAFLASQPLFQSSPQPRRRI